MKASGAARLLVVLLALSASATGGERDPMCKFLDDVLKEAPTKFVALRGKPMEGYSPMWEGKPRCSGALN